MRSRSATGKILLLVFVTLAFVPVVVLAILRHDAYSLAALAIPAFSISLAVMFFFPDHTVHPVTDRLDRFRNLRAGTLHAPDAEWLLSRYLPRHPNAPTGKAFTNELTVWILVRSNPPGGSPEQGRLIVAWFKQGHDPVLLRNALVANLSAAEVRAHLNGTAPLDPETIAVLAALTGPVWTEERWDARVVPE